MLGITTKTQLQPQSVVWSLFLFAVCLGLLAHGTPTALAASVGNNTVEPTLKIATNSSSSTIVFFDDTLYTDENGNISIDSFWFYVAEPAGATNLAIDYAIESPTGGGSGSNHCIGSINPSTPHWQQFSCSPLVLYATSTENVPVHVVLGANTFADLDNVEIYGYGSLQTPYQCQKVGSLGSVNATQTPCASIPGSVAFYFEGDFKTDPFGFPNAGYTPSFVSQYDTRFTAIDFGTATNSAEFDVGFYIDADEATTTQADRNPTQVKVKYAKIPTADYSAEGIIIEDAVTPTWGYGTTSHDLELDASSRYDILIQFANGGSAVTGIVPFPLAYVYFILETDSNGAIATTTAPEFYNAVEEQAFAYQPCGILDLTGCISNAGIYLFMPSDSSIDRFNSLQSDLEERAPFVYAFQLPDYWSLMFNTTQSQTLTVSASTSIGTFTFLSEELIEAVPFSSTVRDIVGYLLWAMLAFAIYSRVVNFFSPKENTV